MDILVKVGIAAVVIGFITYTGKKAKDVLDLTKNISLRISQWGQPSIREQHLAIPITIEVVNPTTSTFTADKANIVLSFWQLDQYVKAGTAQVNAIVLSPGANQFSVVAILDLKAISKDVVNTRATVFFNRAINLKADLQLTVAGVTLPVQSFIKQVNV
jgi:DNA-directed RNA polymerase alpha subunit